MKKNSIFESDKTKQGKRDSIKGIKNISRNSGYLQQWKQEKNKRRSVRLKRWGLFLGAVLLTSAVTIFINMQNLNKVRQQYEEYMAQITPVPTQVVEKITPEPAEHSSEFERAMKMYPDAVGYLVIKDTNIDFPIVQGEDNFFFENRNYDRTYSDVAATYMLAECDADTSRHLVIYGENSQIEGRFGHLNSYLDYDFFYTHEYITLELSDGAQTWQVFSVHLASLTFDYKDVYFESGTEYLAYIRMFETMSRFDRGVELIEKDQIVTLVTDYHDLDLEAGYLMIHARRVN